MRVATAIPLDRWFRGELRDYVRDTLLASDARCHAYLDRSAVEVIVRRHESGEANLGQQLWCLLAFERWLRLLPDGAGPAAGRRGRRRRTAGPEALPRPRRPTRASLF